MSKPVYFSALTRAERAVLISSILTFVNAMIPWWYRVHTKREWFSYSAGLNGWGTAVASASAIAALLVLGRTWIWPKPAPRLDGLIYSALGVVAFLCTLVLIGDRGPTWWGLYAGLALSLTFTAAGIARRTERAAGWT